MKKVIVFAFILMFSFPLFAQRVTPNTYSRHDDYMQRSRRKQTAGIIFLSSGAALTAGGTILIIDGVNRNNRDNNYGELSTGDAEAIVGGLITVMGVAAMCGSIPFFVGAHRSRKKAMAILFKTENAPLLFKTSFSRQLYPALTLKIPIGK